MVCKKKDIILKRHFSFIGILISVIIMLYVFHPYFEKGWEMFKQYRTKQIVLEHFRNNVNPTKYKAAEFLLNNMSYQLSYSSGDIEKFEEAYVIMANNAKEFRDSIITKKMENLRFKKFFLKAHSDFLNINASNLIKIIDEACDTWEKVNWNKEYDENIFFNYVLPYRLFDEPFSDWREEIKRNFSYLYSPVVYSEKGVQYPAYKESVVNAKVVDSPDALKGKVVQMDRKGAYVTYNFHSDIAVQKLLRFSYNTLLVDVEAIVELNGKKVGTIVVEPANSKYSFRSSRFGTVVDLQKGDNKITVKYVNKPFSLDYMEVAAYEPYYDEKAIDYSNSYCQIQNVATKNYVSFDTISSKIGQPITLHKYSPIDKTLNLRFDYQGYPCWKICPMDSVNLYLENYQVNLDTMAIVSKQVKIEVENPDPHYTANTSAYQSKYINQQKWVIIPVGDGMCKIMNKLSGLFWESTIDKKSGKEIIVQNYYSGKATQKWKIVKTGKNPHAQSFFKVGNVLSEALKVTDVMKQFQFTRNRGDITPSVASLIKYRTGICKDEVAYVASLSRFLGIPVAVDFVPHWGNRPGSHTWNALILPNGKSTPFYMQYAPGDTTQFTHSPVYIKPKIYRRRYEVNKEIMDELSGEKDIPELYKFPKFTDVTDQYIPTTDVTCKIPMEFSNRSIAYICVNDKQEWEPVHYGKIQEGKVTFRSMGRNVLYSVGVWDSGKIKPVGNPFIVEKNGKIRYLTCNRSKRLTMTLYRKYPFFAQFDSFKNRMDLGEFQGSNSMDFSSVSTLYVHKGFTNGCSYNRKLNPSKEKYKYLRYIGPKGSYCNVNEISFFNSKGKKLTGRIIGTEGTEKHTKETVFDGDVLTGFNGTGPDGNWVGLELSEPSDVASITYMPRNDGNCVEVEDKYQLLVYDKGRWNTLAWIRAKDTKLVLKNIPSGGLYLLRDRTKGKEERIFTYENDKQVWW